ncbi:MAG: DUF58 domain-containing protein [Clostridiaceae bacterium]
MKLDLKFIVWMLLISAVFYYFGGVTGTRMLVASVVLFVIAIIQGKFISSRITAYFKHNSGRIEVGDPVTEKLIIKNNSFMLAPSIEITAEDLSEKRVYSIPARGDIQVNYDLTPRVRGIVKTGKIELLISDVLNISKTLKVLSPEKIKVYPHVLDKRADKMIYDTLGEGNLFRTYSKENPYVIREMRKYRTGDNIRKINWKVSAKLNELYIRKGETTEEKDILIVLDMHEYLLNMDQEGLFENALVTDSLSLSKGILKLGIPHGFIMNDVRKQYFNISNKEAYERLEEDLLLNKAEYKFNIKNFVSENNEYLLERGTLIFFTYYDRKNFDEISKLKHNQNEIVICTPNLDRIKDDLTDIGVKMVNLKGDGYEVDK